MHFIFIFALGDSVSFGELVQTDHLISKHIVSNDFSDIKSMSLVKNDFIFKFPIITHKFTRIVILVQDIVSVME